jgi:hypothetical protein
MKMKVPAIALAVMLSAASMYGQATIEYGAAMGGSATAASGASKGINPAAGLGNKMASAMGDQSGSTGTHTEVHSGMHSTMHSGTQSTTMHCKEMGSDAQGMSGMHCKEMHGAKAGCCKNKDGKMTHAMGCCKHGKCAREKKEQEKKS